MSKARELANLGNAYSDGALSNRNLIINGGMAIDQRNGGSGITPTAWAYSVDRFRAEISQASKFSIQQNAGSVTPPVGFSDYLGVTSSSSYTPVTADYFYINTQIEGYNSAQLGWGASGAKDATLSFWVRSSLTGTHSGALRNGGNTRSYPFTFTVSTANTWEYKSVTIEGDTSGTWAKDNTSGVQVSFSLGGGTTYRGTAGAWASADYRAGATGSVDIVGTNNATFYITGVQLEVGDQATPFEHRSYGDELARCQRYYYRRVGSGRHFTGGNGSVALCYPTCYLPSSMRTTPSFSYSAVSDFYIEGLTGGGQSIVTAMSTNASADTSFTIQAVSGGSTSGTAGQVMGTGGGASSWTAFDAEL